VKHSFSIMLATFLAGFVYASEARDTTVNIYGVGAKTDALQDSHAGAGIMFDSEMLKVKFEGTSEVFKTGAVVKLSPVQNWYTKIGINYVDQKMYAPDSSSARVHQYSGAAAVGYMAWDDIYLELGGSYTDLNGEKLGTAYQIVDEETGVAYVEAAKRWETPIGSIDTTANAGQVYYEFMDDQESYGVAVDYYPANNIKLGAAYQYEQDNISASYSAHYSLAFVEYSRNYSADTYYVTAGLKVAFDNLFDVSTWRAPANIKPHLSELHRFEQLVFSTNMNIQSTAGVQAADLLPAPVPVSTPTIAMADQTVNDWGGGAFTNLPAPTVTGVEAGATYSIVSDPTGGMLTIDAVTGVMTWSGNVLGNQSYIITEKVTNPDGGTDSVTFTLYVTDNA